MTSRQITLNDGRILSYAHYGHPHGRPLIYFHGWPSSRYEAALIDDEATRQQIWVIAPDRPGFGRSTFQRHRTFLDWPADVRQLAAALGLERFAVLGHSGGGPYAAVCALLIPDHLTAAGIVSGLGPAGAPGAAENMRPLNRRITQIGRRAPWLLRPMAWLNVRSLKRDGAAYFRGQMADLPQPDQAAMNRPAVVDHLLAAGLGAFRQGTRAAAQENALYARPFGFRYEDITTTVHLWHGLDDKNAPPAMARYVASSIPNCRAAFLEGEGHVSLFANHQAEILQTLRPGPG